LPGFERNTDERGRKFDPSRAVIPGAQVAVVTQDGKPVAQLKTDNAGNFSLNVLPIGAYVIGVTKQGFREIKQQAKVASSGAQPPIRIVMPVAAVAEEMTVAASDTSAQVSTEVCIESEFQFA